MSVNLSFIGGAGWQFFDDNGNPLSGGKLYTYAAGTSTPQATYTSRTGLTANTNPIILDSAGRTPEQIWSTEGMLYKYVIKNANDVLVRSWDNIGGSVVASDLSTELANNTNPAKGDAFVGFMQSNNLGNLANAVGRTVHQKLQEVISVKDFGAVGDGVADDTFAIQTAIDTVFNLGGGTVYFPNGSYKVTDVVNLKSGVSLVGTGRRKAYPGVFTPSATGLSTIFATHTGRCCLLVYNTTVDANSNISLSDINIATLGAAGSDGPVAGIGFECGNGQFQRDFTLNRVGIHGFTSAIDCFKTSGVNTQMGVIKIINCSINLNNWIARTLNGTQWNSFVFLYNEAGQNGYSVGGGGIDIAGHSVSIDYNLMEGQRDPVRIVGAYRGVSVRGNYFEENVGEACVNLKGVRGPWFVGPNTYLAVNNSLLKHTVLLSAPCGMGQSTDPYWPELVYKTPLPQLGNEGASGANILNPTVNAPYARVDRVVGSNYSQLPQVLSIVTSGVTVDEREINPQTGLPMPVQQYTTSGSGAVTFNYSIAASPGVWVVSCFLVKQQPDANIDQYPYISMSVNGTGASGSRDYPLMDFNNYFSQGEWALVTTAIKLEEVPMTSLTVTVFPFGVSPIGGRIARFLRPLVYTVDTPSKIIPYIDNYVAQSAIVAPTGGTWNKGDFLSNSLNPSQNQSGFVCSVSGTPGTWTYS